MVPWPEKQAGDTDESIEGNGAEEDVVGITANETTVGTEGTLEERLRAAFWWKPVLPRRWRNAGGVGC